MKETEKRTSNWNILFFRDKFNSLLIDWQSITNLFPHRLPCELQNGNGSGDGSGRNNGHPSDNPFYSNIDSMPDIRPRRKSIPLVSELVRTVNGMSPGELNCLVVGRVHCVCLTLYQPVNAT